MYIKVNNETQEIPENTSVQLLVENLKISTNGILIIQSTQGG